MQLNGAQRDVVESDENLLVCACPGSGKTRVLVEKTARILERRPGARVLLTTFSREAAREIETRLRKRVRHASATQRLTVGTFHALALRQVKAAGQKIKLLNAAESEHLLRRLIQDLDLEWDSGEAEAEIFKCKVLPHYRAQHRDAAELTEAFDHALMSAGAKDFTDVLRDSVSAMDAGEIAPLDVTDVLTDEYQDIDPLQFEWLMRHVPGRLAAVVGDDDQSIYGFRLSMGYRGMMAFVEQTGARIVTLDHNYRSTSPILAAASRLIAHNLDRVPKTLVAERGEGRAPLVVQTDTAQTQAKAVLEEIARLCEGNPIPPAAPGRLPYRFGVRAGQIAVLARNNQQLVTLERLLIQERVPYIRAGRTLWDEPAVQVLVSLLTSLDQGHGIGLEVALHWAGVPDAQLRALADCHDGNLFALLTEGGPSTIALPAGRRFLELGRVWARRLADRKDDNAITGVIFGVSDWMGGVLKRRYEAEAAEARGEVWEGKPTAAQLRAQSIVANLAEILASLNGPLSLRLSIAQKDPDQTLPRVVLSTFHGSKGLEWENVFLLDVTAGSIPSPRSEDDDNALEEERRLLYVAMTRARDMLVLYTRTRRKDQSVFLHDARLLRREDTATSP